MAAKRVQQWLTYTRSWWLFDAQWQDPYKSSIVLAKYLSGQHKPIFNGVYADSGDHVVVINSKHIALKSDEWFYRVYFHHSGYPGGASWTKAWEVHKKNPTMIMDRAVYRALGINLERRNRMARLHIYPEGDIPAQIAENITDQIRPLRPIPKKLKEFTPEEIETFPKLYDYPKNYELQKTLPKVKSPTDEKIKITT